jgi:hypothetical protein
MTDDATRDLAWYVGPVDTTVGLRVGMDQEPENVGTPKRGPFVTDDEVVQACEALARDLDMMVFQDWEGIAALEPVDLEGQDVAARVAARDAEIAAFRATRGEVVRWIVIRDSVPEATGYRLRIVPATPGVKGLTGPLFREDAERAAWDMSCTWGWPIQQTAGEPPA